MLDLPQKLSRNDETVLAIPVGLAGNKFALTRFTAPRSTPGWIVQDKEIREWYLEGFFEHQGQLFLYGPYQEGLFLEDILELQPERGLPYFIQLVEALASLRQRGLCCDYLQTDAVYFLRSGGLLFLPPGIMKKVLDSRPQEYSLKVFDQINHPDLPAGEAKLSFGLAALSYRSLSGEYPFQADTGEEIRHRIRYLRLPPPTRMRPELKEEVSQALLACLNQEGRSLLSLETWGQKLKAWKQEGLFRNLLEEEKAAIRQQGTANFQRFLKTYQWRRFWLKHWKQVAVVAVIVLAVGGFAGSLIKKWTAPRVTRGFAPREVVEAFYTGINRLDHALMEDCVIGNAGKGVINEVIQMYVTSRITLGYEGKSHLIPADQWEEMGRPELEPPQAVFGITAMKIEALRLAPLTFQASYQKWLPVPAENPGENPEPEPLRPDSSAGSRPSYQSFNIVEQLFLKEDRGDWVIHRIDRLSSQPQNP